MRATEFIMEETTKQGTYAALKFSEDTAKAIQAFCKENEISNCLKLEDYHSTILYSRKHLDDYEPAGDLETLYVATPNEFEVWDSPANSKKARDTKCLVLKYKCQEQVDRFNELMDKHDATYDYDEYQPHVTLSYDVGEDFDIESLDINDFPQQLELVQEYGEDPDLDITYDSDE